MPAPSNSIIFLDIDGVLCTQSAWKPEIIAADGYSEFNAACIENLNLLIEQTGAGIILTSSRRMTKTIDEFQEIMQRRGCCGQIIGKVDDATAPSGVSRAVEIAAWLNHYGQPAHFVILDDDSRLAELPHQYRSHWVRTTYYRGFDAVALSEALAILRTDQ
ncbi:HAD domain-containing protein [Hymenobacter sp. B81]|uniref:HAD domain-containing protein n=1 Tax=Hymenobacter sp. B81 TaxID=3344878 RepID=UPI0037DC1E6B